MYNPPFLIKGSYKINLNKNSCGDFKVWLVYQKKNLYEKF